MATIYNPLSIIKFFKMKITKTIISGATLMEPKVYKDGRGWFMEAWNLKELKKTLNDDLNFVQENHSFSKKNVLRGLHYQYNNPQGKLVRVVSGGVLDVIVDLRKRSSSFGKYYAVELSSSNKRQLWIPPGLAHGFFVKSEYAEVIYQTNNFYNPNDEYTLKWDDKDLNIDWGLNQLSPIVSEKDSMGLRFKDAHYYD